jgi:hypothetical protein
VSRFGVNRQRNHAIVLSQNRTSVNTIPADGMIRYLEQVNNHVPLAAIADQVACKVTYEPIVEWAAGFLDGQFKIVIGLVEFIPEK